MRASVIVRAIIVIMAASLGVKAIWFSGSPSVPETVTGAAGPNISVEELYRAHPDMKGMAIETPPVP